MLLAGEMLKTFLKMCFWLGKCAKVKDQLLTFPQWERFLGGLCASGWGDLKNVFEHVLLAGEVLKSEKPTFNISPVGAFLLLVCASGWGNVNFFSKMCFWLGKF